MTDDTPLSSAGLNHLAHRCAHESALFAQRQPFDPRFCYELFRLAVAERNQRAWELLYSLYLPRVQQWVRRDSAFDSTGESEDTFANAAFARFWTSVPSERFAAFADLASLLKYLQVCAHSAIIDHLRAMRQPLEDLDDEAMAADRQPADDVDAAIDRETFWAMIAELLADEAERKVMHDSFVLGLPPRQVQERNPHLFSSVQDVYRVKQNVLVRLRRNPRLQTFAPGH